MHRHATNAGPWLRDQRPFQSPGLVTRRCAGGCSPVAVVVLVEAAVEAAVLEGLVPFLVPVTNSICGTQACTDVDELPESVKLSGFTDSFH